jgi:hypothetical protein
MKCPNCQKQNRPGLLLCEHCGHQLLTLSDFSRYQTRSIATEPATLAPLDFQRLGTGYLHRSSVVTLDLLDANKKVSLKTTGHIVLGRADKDSQWQPTVDLTPYGAVAHGVSRVHADLYFESDQVFVLELGSANGTRVNGVALQIGAAQQIHNGDLLEMGRLRLRVYFGEPSA